jgi:hypothetical protein
MKKILLVCTLCSTLMISLLVKADTASGQDYFDALGCSCPDSDPDKFICKKSQTTLNGVTVQIIDTYGSMPYKARTKQLKTYYSIIIKPKGKKSLHNLDFGKNAWGISHLCNN